MGTQTISDPVLGFGFVPRTLGLWVVWVGGPGQGGGQEGQRGENEDSRMYLKLSSFLFFMY